MTSPSVSSRSHQQHLLCRWWLKEICCYFKAYLMKTQFILDINIEPYDYESPLLSVVDFLPWSAVLEPSSVQRLLDCLPRHVKSQAKIHKKNSWWWRLDYPSGQHRCHFWRLTLSSEVFHSVENVISLIILCFETWIGLEMAFYQFVSSYNAALQVLRECLYLK